MKGLNVNGNHVKCNLIYFYILEVFSIRRLGNVRSHFKFRPAQLHLSLNCLPNEEEIKKITYQHIAQQTT